MNNNQSLRKLTSLLIILVVWLTACGGEIPTEEPYEEPTEESIVMPDVDFAVMPGGALEAALKGEYRGTTVTVDGAFEGNDPDGVKMNESVAAFEEATGIDVNYIGNKEFEATISVRVDAGDAPDIVDFPQPGKAAQFVKAGYVIDVASFISEDWLSRQYNQSWRDMATIEGVEAGVFHRFNGKSLVWYPKKAWEAAGYEIPETWDDLLALTQQIADDGDTAWCIGIESGAATGWAATDWTEEMMLRTTSLYNYDAWVAGALTFDSPEVKNAIDTWSELWFNDNYVFGGRSSIVSTFFGDSPAPMFDDPPKCWMHKQGNFITGFFPEGTEAGVDYSFFYFPPVDPAYGKPFLVAGDVMVMFNDRPEVRALMEYFTVPQSAKGWLEGGGALAAHQTATPDMYGVELERGIAELVAEATSFRFDGSDLMPGEVGAGSFWEYISTYVAGSKDLDTAMQAIDATWEKPDIYALIDEEYQNCGFENDYRIKCYSEYDIEVSLERELDSDLYLVAVDLPIGNVSEFKSDNDEFRPNLDRVVANFEVVHPYLPSRFVPEFKVPIELIVYYTGDDVAFAGGLDKLELGYWDEVEKYWVSFNKHPEKYELYIEGDETGGYVWVTISSWGDRHIVHGGGD